MKAIVQVRSAHDPATELRTLRSSLLFEEALRGRVEFRPATFSGTAADGDALVVTLGADGAGSALTRGLAAWMQQHGPGLQVRLTVDIEPGQLTQATAQDLATLLDPSAAANVAAPRAGQGEDRQRLITRINDSVFRKPPRGRRGYDEDDVDAFLDELVASIQSGSPMDPAAIGTARFGKPPFGKRGYDEDSVDAFLEEIKEQLRKL